MQTVDRDVDEIETIHLYVVREAEVKPYSLLPVFWMFLCLLSIAAFTLYEAGHPVYEHKQLTVPAILLPLKTFNTVAPIIPTGVKSYPATTAHGMLTITNGSVISQTLPAGFNFLTNSGVQIIIDSSVFVPPGNANGYGYAAVSAHASISGKQGNISVGAIDTVEGSSIYIRNLSAFSGGKDSYSVTYATVQDKQTAFITARNLLAVTTHIGYHYPCEEDQSRHVSNMVVTWHCQFVTFRVPLYMHVVSAKLAGNKFLVDVMFIARPMLVRTRFGIGH